MTLTCIRVLIAIISVRNMKDNEHLKSEHIIPSEISNYSISNSNNPLLLPITFPMFQILTIILVYTSYYILGK